LKAFIDSLTYAKFNVFHWHIVDSQSFPLQSTTYPKLWNGAYSHQERYTVKDVAEIVEYARTRGVRVMMEIDLPGHADSWCVGYPEICPSTNCTSPLDPSNQATYDLIKGMFGELTGGSKGAGLVPDNLFHLGGDEVDTSCWSNTPRIAKWLSDNNKTTDEAYMDIVEAAHDIVAGYGRDPVNWEEVFNHFGTKLDPRSIIHIWLDHATLGKVVDAGYRGILSNQDVWYLDHLDTTWQQFYNNDPHTNITDPSKQLLVLGGEVCMWGETVDPSDLMATVWPRAAAAAERLWSAASVDDVNAALPRLEDFRCLLDRRGVGAAPTLNGNARTAPPGPGGCYKQ
jgi:hexosaminidase